LNFREAQLPRRRTPNVRLTDLGDLAVPAVQFDSIEDFYYQQFYKPAITAVINEMESRFEENVQTSLIALQNVVTAEDEDKESITKVASLCKIDKDLISAERQIAWNMDFPDDPKPDATLPLSDMASWFHRHALFSLLPNFGKVLRTFAVIPVTSCSAERSFSTMRQILTYLRSTMGEERLSNIAIVYCNRDIANLVLQNDVDFIIDKFGRRSGRQKHLIL
jgi:hypothetical protein